jgi:hypothetical protein
LAPVLRVLLLLARQAPEQQVPEQQVPRELRERQERQQPALTASRYQG